MDVPEWLPSSYDLVGDDEPTLKAYAIFERTPEGLIMESAPHVWAAFERFARAMVEDIAVRLWERSWPDAGVHSNLAKEIHLRLGTLEGRDRFSAADELAVLQKMHEDYTTFVIPSFPATRRHLLPDRLHVDAWCWVLRDMRVREIKRINTEGAALEGIERELDLMRLLPDRVRRSLPGEERSYLLGGDLVGLPRWQKFSFGWSG